jgi:ubiquinone/menaquinone biosynthesis C-methylase UbiE
MADTLPKLYDELADWWQVISPTEDYADEAAFFNTLFKEKSKIPVRTILELGAGGGNVAYYLKQDFKMTLTDLSPGMLAMSKQQNPDCEHIVGDMRDIRLDRTFDGVFIHDAIMYMTSETDLQRAIQTAYEHCKPGGVVVIAPDCTKEHFKATTDYEGHDKDGRSARYIQWNSDPDPSDSVFNCEFIIALKEGEELSVVTDRQVCGIFPRQTWLDIMTKVGFTPHYVEDTSTSGEVNERLEVFVGLK